MKSEAERWREERETVERRRPWLAFSRDRPVEPPKAERDPFAWQSIADLLPVAGSAEGIAPQVGVKAPGRPN